jgi:hypothetical protein
MGDIRRLQSKPEESSTSSIHPRANAMTVSLNSVNVRARKSVLDGCPRWSRYTRDAIGDEKIAWLYGDQFNR